MITTLKQPSFYFAESDILRQKSHIPRSKFSSFPQTFCSRSKFSVEKPLCVSSGIKGLGFIDDGLKKRKPLIQCEAYEADGSQNIGSSGLDGDSTLEAAKKVKIGTYFVTWWAMNVVFNIYNKKVLNAFPYPWLTSTLSLGVGSLIM
ncbi:hypothetical protein Drorol1_Dr00017155 [Drosera rotundifolia]